MRGNKQGTPEKIIINQKNQGLNIIDVTENC